VIKVQGEEVISDRSNMVCVKVVIKVQGKEVISDQSNMVCVKVVIKVQGEDVISDHSNILCQSRDKSAGSNLLMRSPLLSSHLY
jgi:hypothetical protein